MDLSSTYENRISLSNETVEINMNDAIMKKQYEENPYLGN
jgi:hypothetical protein